MSYLLGFWNSRGFRARPRTSTPSKKISINFSDCYLIVAQDSIEGSKNFDKIAIFSLKLTEIEEFSPKPVIFNWFSVKNIDSLSRLRNGGPPQFLLQSRVEVFW